MKDEERYKLHFGPYRPPKVRPGDRLFDEIHGTIIVARFSGGEIPWPCRKTMGRHSLVLCGDLVKAVRRESNQAVAYWWGVSTTIVTRWRSALGVKPSTPGTYKLRVTYGKEFASTGMLNKAVWAAADPIRSFRRAKRLKRRGHLQRESRRWTSQEDALLGKMFDQDVARKLDCSVNAVRTRRYKLGVPSIRRKAPRKNGLAVSPGKLIKRRLELRLRRATVAQRAEYPSYARLEGGSVKSVSPQTAHRLAAALECSVEDILLRRAPRRRAIPDESLLGTVPEEVLARRWRMSFHDVRDRRMELGIPTFQSRRYPPIPDESLLGTMPDRKLAAMWGIRPGRVFAARAKLGIPNCYAQRRQSIADESLLGTQPDRKLAQMWGIPCDDVYKRRRELGIPSFMEATRVAVLPQRLRALRAKLGVAQQEIAKRAGLGISSFNHIENGVRTTITAATAERIAKAFKCPIEDFAKPLVAKPVNTAYLREADK